MPKSIIPICESCGRGCEDHCAAIDKLSQIYNEQRLQEKNELIKSLRPLLDIQDFEAADDLRNLAERVIAAMPELHIIRDFDIRVAYVRSFEPKRDKGSSVNADCRKVNGTYTAFLPYDFIITVYEPNSYYMTENQLKILMLHELRHIGIGERGLRIENHDVEDFKDILVRYGINWNGLDEDVPDILAGGESGKRQSKKQGKRK